jgi:hypothetical protein
MGEYDRLLALAANDVQNVSSECAETMQAHTAQSVVGI